jgi:hypothetical protein
MKKMFIGLCLLLGSCTNRNDCMIIDSIQALPENKHLAQMIVVMNSSHFTDIFSERNSSISVNTMKIFFIDSIHCWNVGDTIFKTFNTPYK